MLCSLQRKIQDEDDFFTGDLVDELVLDDLLAEDKQDFRLVSVAVQQNLKGAAAANLANRQEVAASEGQGQGKVKGNGT